MRIKNFASVWDLHRHEISEYEQRFGKLAGRLFYAMCILSDVQGLSDDEAIKQEINEVKELISSVMKELEKNQKLKNEKFSGTVQIRIIGKQEDINKIVKVLSAGFEFSGMKFSGITSKTLPSRKNSFHKRLYMNIR